MSPAPDGDEAADPAAVPHVISIFGPTGIGKTGVSIALSGLLEERGEAPVAINCDAIQVYRGLEIISGAADEEERLRLEHRLLGFVPVDQEYSAGRFGERAHEEIDALLGEGRRPIVVGGTGLYLRAALAEIEFRPAVPEALRRQVEEEVERRGPAALHAELPGEYREGIHPNDRKRIARTIELLRDGQVPAKHHGGGGELWTARLRRPTMLFGLAEEDEVLMPRIDARIREMAAAGAAEEVRAAEDRGASRTARAAIGYKQFLEGDVSGLPLLHRRYGRRQMTWMRRMDGVEVIDRGGRDHAAVAEAILARIDALEGQNACGNASG